MKILQTELSNNWKAVIQNFFLHLFKTKQNNPLRASTSLGKRKTPVTWTNNFHSSIWIAVFSFKKPQLIWYLHFKTKNLK